MLWLAVLSGLGVGGTLAVLGGGGSILAVPILVYLLGQEPHAAITGSLVVVGVTAAVATAGHLRAGRVNVRSGLIFGGAGVPGAMLGAYLSRGVNGSLLLLGFASIATISAVAMLARWRRSIRHDRVGSDYAGPSPTEPREQHPARGAFRPHPLVIVATATGIGLLTGLLGVGGGFLIVPALTVILAMSMRDAVGTSLLAITITSTAALLTRLFSQYGALGDHNMPQWTLVAAFGAAAAVAGLAGDPIVSRLRPAWLTVAFATLLLAVAGVTGAESLGALL